jgi:DNA-binding NarL/FixJ family response regulator
VSPHSQTARTLPAEKRRVRCVVVHGHALVREALRRLLETELLVEVVAEAATAAETLRAVWERSPDLVLGDAGVLRLPAGEAAHWLRRGSSETQVLFLEAESSQPASRESAAHILTLGCTGADLRRAMDGLFRGKAPRNGEPDPSTALEDDETTSPLTARQADVVRLIAQGRTVRETATTLGVSAKTVDTHKTNLMRRLGIHNKAELVLWAVKEGLVETHGNSAQAPDSMARVARRQEQAMRARSARLETSRSGTAATALTAPTPHRAEGRLTHTAGKPKD